MSYDPFDRLQYAPPFYPLEFFALSSVVHFAKETPTLRSMRRSFLLDETQELLGEEKFAQVALAYSDEGIYAAVFVDKPVERVEWTSFARGDAVELFFDTRDVKTALCATRFCHHFLFLPQEENPARELTHFRTEDTHPLCDPLDLSVETKKEKKAYTMQIFIPAQCLHGYDPIPGSRIGFTYRIHRAGGRPQHYAAASSHFMIEQSPRLWATLFLEKP